MFELEKNGVLQLRCVMMFSPSSCQDMNPGSIGGGRTIANFRVRQTQFFCYHIVNPLDVGAVNFTFDHFLL